MESNMLFKWNIGGVGVAFTRLIAFALLILIEKCSMNEGFVSSASRTHHLSKRMDLELCLGQFDVHKNNIIRTGESQSLGGKYLQGLELDTVEECQRLCCETETCDVYIFEEKNDGYCYLFECGPPENFHCKFTRHANYTSAVLTMVRHGVEVTTPKPNSLQLANGVGNGGHSASKTTNISQQEWELSNLKAKPETREKTHGLAVNNAGVGSANGNENGNTMGKVVNNTAKHCGRFQFSCHSGECIAVYNACDGIPQCEDGSDEGPECTEASASMTVSRTNQNTPPLGSVAQKPQYQSPVLHQQSSTQHLQSIQQGQQLPADQAVVAPPVINNREEPSAWSNRKIVAEAQMQREVANTADLNSRIFSHKGGLQLPTNGVVSYSNPNSQNVNPMFAATLQRSGLYMPQAQDVQGNVYSSQSQSLLQTQQQQQQQQYIPSLPSSGNVFVPPNVGWQQQQQSQQPQLSSANADLSSFGLQTIPAGPSYILNNPQHLSEQQVQQQQSQVPLKSIGPLIAQQSPQIAITNQVEPAGLAPAMPQNVNEHNGPATSIKQFSAVKGVPDWTAYGTSGYEEDYEEKVTEPPKKQRKHKKVKVKTSMDAKQLAAAKAEEHMDPIELALAQQKQHAATPSPVHEQYKMIHEHLTMEFRDHDGQSERPGGALLSLTMGLLVTAALAILIGCRWRTVGRRARRIGGKAPYSHEADFLVNGMYL